MFLGRALFFLEGDETACGSDEDFATGGTGDSTYFTVTISLAISVRYEE